MRPDHMRLDQFFTIDGRPVPKAEFKQHLDRRRFGAKDYDEVTDEFKNLKTAVQNNENGDVEKILKGPILIKYFGPKLEKPFKEILHNKLSSSWNTVIFSPLQQCVEISLKNQNWKIAGLLLDAYQIPVSPELKIQVRCGEINTTYALQQGALLWACETFNIDGVEFLLKREIIPHSSCLSGLSTKISSFDFSPTHIWQLVDAVMIISLLLDHGFQPEKDKKFLLPTSNYKKNGVMGGFMSTIDLLTPATNFLARQQAIRPLFDPHSIPEGVNSLILSYEGACPTEIPICITHVTFGKGGSAQEIKGTLAEGAQLMRDAPQQPLKPTYRSFAPAT